MWVYICKIKIKSLVRFIDCVIKWSLIRGGVVVVDSRGVRVEVLSVEGFDIYFGFVGVDCIFDVIFIVFIVFFYFCGFLSLVVILVLFIYIVIIFIVVFVRVDFIIVDVFCFSLNIDCIR